ncbi:hypothetical protein A2U01_0046762, partial [Trifolium medium]|nr:hypothetical protein [Trifolium medium]
SGAALLSGELFRFTVVDRASLILICLLLLSAPESCCCCGFGLCWFGFCAGADLVSCAGADLDFASTICCCFPAGVVVWCESGGLVRFCCCGGEPRFGVVVVAAEVFGVTVVVLKALRWWMRWF